MISVPGLEGDSKEDGLAVKPLYLSALRSDWFWSEVCVCG